MYQKFTTVGTAILSRARVAVAVVVSPSGGGAGCVQGASCDYVGHAAARPPSRLTKWICFCAPTLGQVTNLSKSKHRSAGWILPTVCGLKPYRCSMLHAVPVLGRTISVHANAWSENFNRFVFRLCRACVIIVVPWTSVPSHCLLHCGGPSPHCAVYAPGWGTTHSLYLPAALPRYRSVTKTGRPRRW